MNIKKSIDEALRVELLKIVEELKKKHIELGQKSSGKWIDSLEVSVSNGTGFIYGANYTEQLAKGRKPGALPPISPLEEWARIKLGKSGKEALNMAFAVAIKISKEGSKTYREGGTDLIEGVITAERIRKVHEEVGKVISFKIQSNLLKEI